jgi:hypothetical protein
MDMRHSRPGVGRQFFRSLTAAVIYFGALGALPVLAQNWNPAPGTVPPGNNLPGPIWNASAAGFVGPQSASVDINGNGTFGGALTISGLAQLNSGLTVSGGTLLNNDLIVSGSTALGNYAPDPLLALTLPQVYIGDGSQGTIIGGYQGQQTKVAPGDIFTDGTLTASGLTITPNAGVGKVLTSDGNGVATWQTATSGCATGVFHHLTAATFDGQITSGGSSGYAGADQACAQGTHICTPDEVLHTVICAPATLPSGQSAWIANGAPSFTAPAANDCAGWTSKSSSAYGSFWQFSGPSGGYGIATTCNLSLKIACCS